MRQIESLWYRSSHTWLTFILLPFSWLFHLIVAIRYFFYRYHIKKTVHFSVPVIVVGNITVGGAGKTPLVIWLANYLRKKGYRPGIVTRGVGGEKQAVPRWVDKTADTREVGDEAVLLARRTGCPVVVGVDRAAVVAELLDKADCDVVISDDGLQHYRLGRDIEIAVVDSVRQFGNASLLPAGPLREPLSRLQRVNFVVWNGKRALQQQKTAANEYNMQLVGDECCLVRDANQRMSLAGMSHQSVHAIAGIGHPERFFMALRDKNLMVIPHSFPDHYHYQQGDITFADNLLVLMTEKDAVKCTEFADERHWYLPVDAVVDEALGDEVLLLLQRRFCAQTH